MKNNRPHKCNVCGETIGFIDIEAGHFDSRYYDNLENHTCKEWTEIKEVA